MGTKYDGTPTEKRALDTYIKLTRAAETILTKTNAHLSQYDLTTTQFGVLEALYHLGSQSQGDLAAKLLTSTGNLTTVLKNIEKRGLITRDRDPNDNRYRVICITEKGRTLIDSILQPHVAGIVYAMGVLTRDEQDELARLCKKLGLSVADSTQ